MFIYETDNGVFRHKGVWFDAAYHGPFYPGRWNLHTWPYDQDKVVACVMNTADNSTYLVTRDDFTDAFSSFSAWTERHEGATDGYKWEFAGFSGDPTSDQFGYLVGVYDSAGDNAPIAGYTDDAFATIQDKSSNLLTDFVGYGRVCPFLMGI